MLKLSIRVRNNAIALRTIEIRIPNAWGSDRRSRIDMHPFERPYLKAALIDVMALFAWAGSIRMAGKYTYHGSILYSICVEIDFFIANMEKEKS